MNTPRIPPVWILSLPFLTFGMVTGVEPVGGAVLAGAPAGRPNHGIQRGGDAIRDLLFLRALRVDGNLQVTDVTETPTGCSTRENSIAN
jgi:hypothetical protein